MGHSSAFAPGKETRRVSFPVTTIKLLRRSWTLQRQFTLPGKFEKFYYVQIRRNGIGSSRNRAAWDVGDAANAPPPKKVYRILFVNSDTKNADINFSRHKNEDARFVVIFDLFAKEGFAKPWGYMGAT